MIILKDRNGDLYPISDYENFAVKHKVDGNDEMTFSLNVNHEQYPLLYEEACITTDDNEWLIKKIDDDKIDCKLNFDFLKGSFYKDYKSQTRLLSEVLASHLPHGWTVQGAGISSIRRTIEFDFCTDYDVIYRCMSVYGVYFVWKIKGKTVVVYSQSDMQSTGEYLTSELNLKKLSFRGDTTAFATRLYAYGKDGISVADAVVNGTRYGLQYVENKQYADKNICAYWVDERYTVAENLYADAVKKLQTLSYPIRSYECDVVDLAKQNAEYSFLDFSMHKKVVLIDIERNIRVEHQIVEYTEYPDEPSRNKVVLSCVPLTINSSINSAISSVDDMSERMQTDYQTRILMATAMLTGAFGSYPYTDGSNWYMMDDPDPNQAEVVWIINYKGVGKSSTGINGPFTTALTYDDHFITEVIDALVIRGDIIKANSIQASAISQSYKNSVTNEITGAANTVRQEFTAADGVLSSAISTSESNMRSLIQQTESGIMTEVSKKVNNTDFGTKIEQNYSSVKIAWNNISKYIEFENGEIRIYQSTNQAQNDLLMKLNNTGSWYYHNGSTVGHMGTNNITGNVNYKGLVFDLEYGAGYMCWAHRENESDTTYSADMIYHANNTVGKKGLSFLCDTYCYSNLKINDNVRTINYTSGAGGWYSDTHEVGLYGASASVTCDSNITLSSNSTIDCYNNIDMHGYNIITQSDVRLKKNIKNADIKALDILSELQAKSFDWIESDDHCELGFIAQQVQEVLPNVVAESETGKLSIAYDRLIPYLIKAVHELYGAKKSNSVWEDKYSFDEKMAFITANKKPCIERVIEKKTEIKIPVVRGKK